MKMNTPDSSLNSQVSLNHVRAGTSSLAQTTKASRDKTSQRNFIGLGGHAKGWRCLVATSSEVGVPGRVDTLGIMGPCFIHVLNIGTYM